MATNLWWIRILISNFSSLTIWGENISFHLIFVISYKKEYSSLTAYSISFMLSSLFFFAVLITNISDSNPLYFLPLHQCDFIQNLTPYHRGCKEQRQKNKTENCLLENDAFVVSHCQMAWSWKVAQRASFKSALGSFPLLKSNNLQYNTLGCWVNGTNDSSTKCLMFQAFYFIISYRLRAL